MWWLLFLALAISIGVSAWWVEQRYRRPLREAERLALEMLEQDAEEPLPNDPDLIDALERLALQQSELRHRMQEEEFNVQTILGGMLEAVMVVDPKHVIRQVNAQFLRFFEVSDAPIGRTILETIREAEIELLVRLTLESGAPQRREISFGMRSFEASAAPTRDHVGEISGAVMIFHDISRLKQLEEVRREFVANVSHELRTPLSIFRGYLENLLDDPEQPRTELHRVLQIMEKHSTRLNSLVEDLLSLARLESSTPHTMLQPLRLQPFLRQVLDDWKLKLAAKNLTATLSVEPETLAVHGDEARLEEVLHNLLENAVKYSPEKGTISVHAATQTECAELSVTDQGRGIPAADLPHVFGRFYRVEKGRSREHGGTGLGLSIVKHIVQLHGGSVWAESEVGRGTTIKALLPLA